MPPPKKLVKSDLKKSSRSKSKKIPVSKTDRRDRSRNNDEEQEGKKSASLKKKKSKLDRTASNSKKALIQRPEAMRLSSGSLRRRNASSSNRKSRRYDPFDETLSNKENKPSHKCESHHLIDFSTTSPGGCAEFLSGLWNEEEARDQDSISGHYWKAWLAWRGNLVDPAAAADH